MLPERKILRQAGENELRALAEKNKHIFTEHFDPDYTRAILIHLAEFLDRYYFRSRFIGFEQIPHRNNPDHPLIYASNHSGMAFPWDAMIFASGFLKMNRYEFAHAARALAAPMLSQTNLMNPYLINDLWKKAGAVDATTLNFETMMLYEDSNVLIYPEGVPGIGKGFDKRYMLQRFATSFVRMSIKYRTDVIPVYTVNAEYINPYSYSVKWMNRVVNKIGIPFFPLGLLSILLPLQPWLFYTALPAKLTYVMGERIKPYEMTTKPYRELNRYDYHLIAAEIRKKMQKGLNEAVEKYGQKPYEMKELFFLWLKNFFKIPFILPSGWPLLFAEFERQYRRRPRRKISLRLNLFTFFTFLLRNIRFVFFYIPILGWIPMLLGAARKKIP